MSRRLRLRQQEPRPNYLTSGEADAQRLIRDAAAHIAEAHRTVSRLDWQEDARTSLQASHAALGHALVRLAMPGEPRPFLPSLVELPMSGLAPHAFAPGRYADRCAYAFGPDDGAMAPFCGYTQADHVWPERNAA